MFPLKTPLDVMRKVVGMGIMRLWSTLRRPKGIPGQIIAKLPTDERELLKQLTSDEIRKLDEYIFDDEETAERKQLSERMMEEDRRHAKARKR